MKTKKTAIVFMILTLVLIALVPSRGVEAKAKRRRGQKAIKVRQLSVKVPNITMKEDEVELKKGKRVRIPIRLENTKRSNIVWESSDDLVAKVNRFGFVKGMKTGTAEITARIKGTDIEETCEVEVVNYKIYRVKATAYCNCASCSGPGHPRTASGRYPKQGRTLAVDRRLIPLGTRIEMNGKTYYAEDTGGAIRGKKIDVYFSRHSSTSRWGVRYVKIKVFYK